MTNVFLGSDFHSGHLVGLTPPEYQIAIDHPDLGRYGAVQSLLWDRFGLYLNANGPYDRIILVGDLIDGPGSRSSGTELMTTDMRLQANIAKACIAAIPKTSDCTIRIIRGTPYHTGTGEQWEDVIGAEVGAESVEDHGYFTREGVNLDVKHKVGSSSVPYGSATPLMKEYTWALHWAAEHDYPIPHVIIRGHTHTYDLINKPSWSGVILPSLQGLGSRFGKKECSKVVHWGYCSMRIDAGRWNITPHVALGGYKQELVEL